jgi:hypothetical protein
MIIESHAEHKLALRELDRLTRRKALIAPQEAWLLVLSKAIEAYELIHFPIADPTPEEARAFRKSEGGPICAKQGHIPTEKMSAVICDRCGDVLPKP